MEYTTKELIEKLQNKLILNLKEDEIACPECKGLSFVLTQREKSAYIEKCRTCHTGKLYVCSFCGKTSNSGYCDCESVQKQREAKYKKKEIDAYEKAEKISWKDYKGYLSFDSDETLSSSEDLAGWIGDMLSEGEEAPDFLWAYEPKQIIDIDLIDVIYWQAEDGHETMVDNLNLKSPFLQEAQALITHWQEKEGEFLCTFYEDRSRAVIIKDLVDKIKAERNGD